MPDLCPESQSIHGENRNCAILREETSVATGSAAVPARLAREASAPNTLKRFFSRYFYFSIALLMAGLAVWAFSDTVDAHLLHAKPPRPLLLWFHGAAFTAWIVLFIVQSALVRVRKVKVHRTLGWFGAMLAAIMVVSGLIVSVVMLRFEMTVLHQRNAAPFLSILWCDMIIFGGCMALAIYFRKRPEYHRRLVFMATCQLMQAIFVRFHYIGRHDLFFPALDLLIVAGILCDLVVDGRINRVYIYVLPAIIVLQSVAMYLKLVNPRWWQAVTMAILGS
jgi:FtsH-binding integral membrane protein